MGGMPPQMNGPPAMPNGPPMNMPPPGMPPPGSMPPTNVPPPSASTTTAGGASATGLPLDFTGEIWVETKASEGKSYYYNARTRETTWTKPEGNVKILLQEQVTILDLNGGENHLLTIKFT